MKNIIVVGTGLTGCLTTYKIAKKFPNYNISLIESSRRFSNSMDCIKLGGIKINNGYHALDVERSPKLYLFLKNKIKIKFNEVMSDRKIIINNYFLKEKTQLINFPKNLQKCFKKKKLNSKILSIFFSSITGNFKKTIIKVSKKYSDNLQDNLSFFIPWFFPKEYIYKSTDEGDKFRDKIKDKKTKVAVPKNYLFSVILKKFKKIISEHRNINLYLNTKLILKKNKLEIVKNTEVINLNPDYIFISTSPVFLLKKKSNIKNLYKNKRLFVSCLILLKKKLKFKFTEIIILMKNFYQASRFSQIFLNKENNMYLLELIFNNENEIKNQMTHNKVKKIINTISSKNQSKILDYKITRKIFYPKKKTILNCEKEIKQNLKKLKKNRLKIYYNPYFGPINMSKAWILSEKFCNKIQ